MEKGDIEIFLYKTAVVDEINDPNKEIDIETAKRKIREELEVGDDFAEEIPIIDFEEEWLSILSRILIRKSEKSKKKLHIIHTKILSERLLWGNLSDKAHFNTFDTQQ